MKPENLEEKAEKVAKTNNKFSPILGYFWVPLIGIVLGCCILCNRLLTGETVYRGKIDGYEVTYEEKRYSLDHGSEFLENRITLTLNGVTHLLVDSANETNIDWRKSTPPDFSDSKLEKVRISNKGSSKSYYNPYDNVNQINYIDTSSIEGQITKEIFKRANPLYRDLIGKIRKALIEGYRKEHESFVNSFPI